MGRKKRGKKQEPVYILNDFYDSQNDLYLYDSLEEQRYYLTRSFFEAGVEKNNLCVYCFPRNRERMNFKEIPVENLHELKLIRGNIKMLKEEDLDNFYTDFAELKDYAAEEGYEGMHLKTDFGKVRGELMEDVLRLERKLHNSNGDIPVTSISSYNMNFIPQESVNSLTALHDRVMMTTGRGETSIVFFQHPREDVLSRLPDIDIVSSQMMEESVKKSLKVIILSQLKQRAMCGFDIIKSLVHNFNVLLSQGTVYPILYSLEKDGYLKTAMEPDNKTKLYVPTDMGLDYMESQIREYIQCQEKVLSLIARGLDEKWNRNYGGR